MLERLHWTSSCYSNLSYLDFFLIGNGTEKFEEIRIKLNDTMRDTCDEMISGLKSDIISTLEKMEEEFLTASEKKTINEGQF